MSEPRGIDTHPRFKSAKPPVELPETWLLASKAFGLTIDETAPRWFSFRRRRGGTLVYLNQDCFSHLAHDLPEGFASARVWARDFAVVHGFVYREGRDPHMSPAPRPPRES